MAFKPAKMQQLFQLPFQQTLSQILRHVRVPRCAQPVPPRSEVSFVSFQLFFPEATTQATTQGDGVGQRERLQGTGNNPLDFS